MIKTQPTWIVVMDSAVAHFYALRAGEAGPTIEKADESIEAGLHRHASDLKSDKPGRGFAHAGTSSRHAMEPAHDYHKLEKHDFVRVVAASLERAYDAHAFERLVLVAPARSLGELRRELPDKVKNTLWHEIPKDLVKLGKQELWVRLAPMLEEKAPHTGA